MEEHQSQISALTLAQAILAEGGMQLVVHSSQSLLFSLRLPQDGIKSFVGRVQRRCSGQGSSGGLRLHGGSKVASGHF